MGEGTNDSIVRKCLVSGLVRSHHDVRFLTARDITGKYYCHTFPVARTNTAK